MYCVYILKSQKTGRYYIGQTESIEDRLMTHNKGVVKSTKNGMPWKMIHTESFSTRSEAFLREREIKNYKGGIKFKKLLGLWKD